MNRQHGYYWVKYHGDWQIGRYDKNRWYLTYDVLDGDSDFSEINETRIPSPDESWGAPIVLVGNHRVAFMNEDSLKEFMRLAKIKTIVFEPELPKTYTLE